MDKYKKYVIPILMSIVTTLVLFSDRVLSLENLRNIFTTFNSNLMVSSIMTIIIYRLYYKYYNEEYDKKVKKASMLLAIIFSLSEIIGFYLINTNSFFNYSMNIHTVLYNILLFTGWFSIFYTILCVLIKYLLEKNVKFKLKKEYSFFTNNKKSVLVVTLFLIAFWLIYYIVFYSGVVTNDSYYQIVQGLGYMPLTNDHPFIHTIIEGLIVKFGLALFGNINSGVALLTFIQMCTLAFIVSYSIRYLAYKKISVQVRFLILLFFALHPVIAIYSITLWKDVWMAFFNLTYVILLYEMCTNTSTFFAKKKRLLLLFFNILLILFSKGTGIIIIVISVIPLLFILKPYIKKILIIFLGAVAIFIGISIFSQKVLNIKGGKIREPLSIPIQQISRTIKYHYQDLTDDEKEVLNEILPVDKMGELYNPVLSDDTKRELNEDNFKKNPFRYIGMWFNLGLKHPFTYIDSFLANSYGYWYPDTVYWTVFNIDYMDRLNHFKEVWSKEKHDEYDYGNYNVGELRSNIKISIVDAINKGIRKIPVIGCLFSIGFYFWINAICLAIIIIKKEYRLLPIFITILATYLICIGSPVYAEFRYAYPALVTLPFIIVFSLKKYNKNSIKKV